MELEGWTGANEMKKSVLPGKRNDEDRTKAPILDLESRSLTGARSFIWIVENRITGPPVLL